MLSTWGDWAVIESLGTRAQNCQMKGNQLCSCDGVGGGKHPSARGGVPWSPRPYCSPSQGSRGELLLSLCYNPSANSIIVNIIKARNLKAMDIGGTSGAGASHGRGRTGQGASGAQESCWM